MDIEAFITKCEVCEKPGFECEDNPGMCDACCLPMCFIHGDDED